MRPLAILVFALACNAVRAGDQPRQPAYAVAMQGAKQALADARKHAAEAMEAWPGSAEAFAVLQAAEPAAPVSPPAKPQTAAAVQPSGAGGVGTVPDSWYAVITAIGVSLLGCIKLCEKAYAMWPATWRRGAVPALTADDKHHLLDAAVPLLNVVLKEQNPTTSDLLSLLAGLAARKT